MTSYTEFRLVVNAGVDGSGKWRVKIANCPLPMFVGQSFQFMPTITSQQVAALRNWAHDDVASLQTIGQSVWDSIMVPHVAGAFAGSLAFVGANKGLRLVVLLNGERGQVLQPGQISPTDLPVEAIFNAPSFLATDRMTPVSRRLQEEPDRTALVVAPPLRVLIVVATPADKPAADGAVEVATIRAALAPLQATGTLRVLVVQQVTLESFRDAVATFEPHLLHFIGHGGIDTINDDDVPRAFLYFVRSATDPNSQAVDADTLGILLRNTAVRLAVLTACQSAGAAAGPGVSGSAFDGVAQQLVAGQSGVSAAVAMQFDLESNAAATFSAELYKELFNDRSLDEAVTLARQALIAQYGLGFRTWVTPALYWRCREGQVFAFQRGATLTQAQIEEARVLEGQRAAYRASCDRFAKSVQGSSARDTFAVILADVDAGAARLGAIYGDSAWLTADSGAPGDVLTCSLWVQSAAAGNVTLLSASIRWAAETLEWVEIIDGRGSLGGMTIANVGADGDLKVVVTGGAAWPIGAREVARLRFRVKPGVPAGATALKLLAPNLTRNGEAVVCTTWEAWGVVLSS
jgi:hypothetical protein